MVWRPLAAALAMLACGAPVALAQSNTVSTVAGTGVGGFSGDDGPATAAQIHLPTAIAAMSDGGYLIADQSNARIRRVTPDGKITTVAGGAIGFSGDNGPATSAAFDAVNGIAPTSGGGILITDSNNNRIRYVDPGGTIHTLVGNGEAVFFGDGGPAHLAKLAFPSDVAVQADGGYLIADSDNHRIRRVAPDGIITTVAGTGTAANTGDGGPATNAAVYKPSNVAVTADGGFLISSQYGHVIRRVSPGGTISTVAGIGTPGFSGDNGQATAAELNTPIGVAPTPEGGFLIVERQNNRVRRVAPDGTITTVVGTGTAGYNGDGAAGTATQLNQPFDVTVNTEGDYLIVDTFSNRIRALDASAPPAEPPPPPPPAPEPEPPPPVEEKNLTPPTIGLITGALYTCSRGTWQGLAADPGYTYRWVKVERGLNGLPRFTTVANTQGYDLPAADRGVGHYCEVTARGASGRVLRALSAISVLSGTARVEPVIVRQSFYGDFRIRGIDVFQTTQPNSGAQMYGFPSGSSFSNQCGGGTPTAYGPSGGGGCALGGRDAQRAFYSGVSVDGRKTAYALVFLDMNGAAASDAAQNLEVTLDGYVGGNKQAGTITKTKLNPLQSTTPWITQAERITRNNFVLFRIPDAWLVAADRATNKRLDLEAKARLPVGAGGGTLSQCPLTFGGPNCSANDSFRVDGVPIYRDLSGLRIRTLPLAKSGQTLNGPETVLGRTRKLFPGGQDLTILPPDAAVTIDPESLDATDAECNGITVRTCRSNHVDAEIAEWRALSKENAEGYGMLVGIHRYDSGSGLDEPGWFQGGTPAPRGIPIIAINDGSRNRPLTAASHEYLHAWGAPHADLGLSPGTDCGGVAGGGSEPWPPENTGRLQGVAFDSRPRFGGEATLTMRVDNAATPLFDLMSYCANNDVDAWLSPRNWNRMVAAMRAFTGGGARAAAVGRAAQAGQGFAVGSIAANSGRIDRVVPPEPDNAVPAPDPASSIHVRSLNASGAVLADNSAAVTPRVGVPGAATFVAAVPAQAAVVELVRNGVVLHRVTRSRPPSVALTAPRRGASVGRTLTVRWSASDPDGDPLQARVEFSRNGTNGWRTVMQGPETGRATIPGRFLTASTRARVRVTVNDGFNEARDVSPALVVAGRAPVVLIASPPAGAEIQAGRVHLAGIAVDDAQKRLRGRALTWFAGDRRIARGETPRVSLAAGRVTIRLVARDSRGRTSSVSRRLAISPRKLVLTALLGPDRVARGTRVAQVRVATSVPATLSAGGRRFEVGPKRQRIRIPLPARPSIGFMRIRLRVVARDAKQPAVRAELLILRI